MKTHIGLVAAMTISVLPVPTVAQSTTCPGHLATIELDGKVSAGSKDTLKAAVMAGEPIRVGWAFDWNNDSKVDVIHWADAMFLTIFENDVFTQIAQIHRQGPKPGASDIELTKEPTYWNSSLGTNGLWRGRFQDGEPVAWKVKSWWCRDPRAVASRDGVRLNDAPNP